MTKTPTSSTDCTSVSGIGTQSWSHASRAISSNNSYATASVDGTTTKYLKCLNYGFAIPSTATINGITVSVERKSSSTSNGGSHDAAMRIVKGGSIGTTDKATATLYTTSDVTEAHGSASDLWGLGWTAADINATTFGAAFAATKPSSSGSSHTISVDVISITVDYTVDTTPPTVSSITLANGNPTGASSVAWTVVFSESVTGVDSADFSLAQAGGVSGASITSVTGSGTTWTVNATTGSGSGTLGLNLVDNDTIIDAAGNKLGGAGIGNGNFTGQVYTIDKLNPTVTSINRNSSNPTTASSVSWSVVFSESVTGVDSADFSLVQAGGVSGASIASVTGSGTSWTVTANTGSGTGTLGLNLVDNDTIIDAASHPLGGAGAGNANFTGQVYTIDRTAPSVTSINRADANPSNADTVTWTAVFSESVTGVDASDFTLAASGLTGAYVASVTGSGATWTVVANTGICSGTCTLGLNLADDDTIVDVVGNKLGGTGAGNGNFTGQVYDISSTSPLDGYSMDEASWNGTLDEVVDSYGGSDGTAYNNATTIIGDTGTCRYGVFDNGGTITKGGVLLPTFPDFTDDFTITAWIRTTDNTKIGQRILIDDESKTTGYGLSLGDGGTGKLRFYSRGASVETLDTSNVITNNTWYYVAAVADIANGQRKIYVFNSAGTLLDSVSVASTWGGIDDGNASIGAETNASSQSPLTYHFRGNLDEMRVYGKALNQAALTSLAQNTHTCATAGPNHLRIDQDGQGQSCQSESVTITTCSGLDSGTPATCLPYTGGITGNIVAKGAGGTPLFTLPFTVATGSSSTTVTVPPMSAQTVTFDTSALSVTPGNALTCWDSGTSISSCNMPVSACPGGSNFNCTETTITPYSSGTARLYTKLAGSPFSFDVVALNSLDAVETNYVVSGGSAKNVTVELFDDSTPAATCGAYAAPVASQTLSIGSTNAGRKTTANFSMTNAYAKLRCRVTDGNAPSTIYGCSSDDFSVHPGAATLMTSANAAVPSVTATPVIKAGTAFTIGATTATSAGYTGTLTLDAAKLTAQLSSNGSTALSGGAVGTLTVSPAVQANAAPSQSNNATWTEVGYLYAAAGAFRDDGFTSVDQAGGDCVSSTTNDAYLADTFDANNKIGCSIGNKTAVSFGRFVPDHFTVVGTIANACAAGTFTYMDQSFALSQTNVVEARNAANGVTQNYAGSYAHGSVSFGAENADTGVDLSSRLTFSSGSWTLGAYTLASTSGTFSRPSTTVSDATWGAFESLDIGLTVNDTDVTTSPQVSGADMNPSVAGGSSFAYKKFSGSPMHMRLGRLNLQNTYGSELLGLPMPLTAEYWNGSSWVANTADSCTALTAPASGSGLTLNLASSGSTTATLSNPLVSGDGGLSLTAPGVTHTGYVDVIINSPSWLKFNWKGAGDTDPAARATFGIYKGNSKFIYIRELY